ncbi:MAG: hypothetical protein J2P31_07705 [Blastocatellia bacterium]|nr:hypothetical protein [Blastocatellia bacterium]
MIRVGSSFESTHIAPGKYLLYARLVAEKEASDEQARPFVVPSSGYCLQVAALNCIKSVA